MLRTAREKERELQETLDAIRDQLNRLESERDTLKRALAEEQRKPAADAELKSDRERQEELERTIESVREQTTEVESQRDELTAELDRAMAERDRMAARRDDVQRERERLSTRLEQLEGSRTYRLMRMSWRVRARIRHPFRRKRRPALSKATKSSQPKKSAPALPAPTAAPPKLKPIPRPTMRPKAAKRATRTEPTAPKTEQTAETRTEVDQATAAEVQPPPAASIDPERERWLAKPHAPPADVSNLRVAGVLDEMSAACFEPDCDLLRIDSEGWAEALEAHEPHLLLRRVHLAGEQRVLAVHGGLIHPPGLHRAAEPEGADRLRAASARSPRSSGTRRTRSTSSGSRRPPPSSTTSSPRTPTASTATPSWSARAQDRSRRCSSPPSRGSTTRSAPRRAQRPPRSSRAPTTGTATSIASTSLQMLLDAAMPFGLEIYDRSFGTEDQAFGFPERFTDRVSRALSPTTR